VITVVADDAVFGGGIDEETGLELPIEEPAGILRLTDAKRRDKTAEIGTTYEELLPPFEFGRVQTQMARQVVMGKVRDAERERQFEEYKDRVGEIVNGTVKRVEYGNVVVDLGRGEGIMRRDQSIPRENFNIGDRIRCYIYDVRARPRARRSCFSRAHGGFMAKLFAQEVPEVYDGVIEIRAVARDPGSRAKMAVISNDSSIDPVGACVGMRGSRVQAVVAELQGEKIDIIQWSQDEATFIVNALAPAEVSKVVMDEEDERVEVVVPDEQLSLAIGRRGQNVRLASQLTGWQIDIMTESQESERRQREFAERTAPVPGSPGRGRGHRPADRHRGLRQRRGHRLRRRLGDRGHRGLRRGDRRRDPGPRRDVPGQGSRRVRRQAQGARASRTALLEIEGVTLPMAVALGEGDVKTVEDLAGLVPDDLRGWFETKNGERVREPGILEAFGLDPQDAELLIMRARVAMGWIEAPEEPEPEYAEEEALEGAGTGRRGFRRARNGRRNPRSLSGPVTRHGDSRR
jgi:N utilization substance protein A